MGTTVKHVALSVSVGLAFAVVVALAWWLGSLAFGAGLGDHALTALPILGVGILAALLAGLLISIAGQKHSRQLEQQLAAARKVTPPTVKRPPKRRRRHPLDRGRCLAHVNAARHWRRLSKSLGRLLRTDPDTLVDQSVFTLLFLEDVPALDRAFTEAQQTRHVQTVLCRFQLPTPSANGKAESDDITAARTAILPVLDLPSLIHVRIEIWAKLNRAGKVDHFACRFVDLSPYLVPKERELSTARRELQGAKGRWHSVNQDLTRLKLSYRDLYQNAPVMYFSLDSQGRLVTFNETLVETLGYQRRELQGVNYTALLAPATAKSYVTIASSMPLEEGERETQWRKKDGTVIDIWLHSVPLFDEEGRFVRCRSAALDLTEKSRLANELRARGDELERMNKQLRVINSELEAFTHVVSHDLKEPLRTLQAYSHILAEEHGSRLGPDGFQYVNHLIRASQRLGLLIDELLNLSQAGRATRSPQVFNLLEVVATVRQDLVDLLQRKQATIQTEGSPPGVIGDPVRITQLLANLIGNGLKYNRAADPRIVIGATDCPDDPKRLTVFVRDNGIGIDPAFHEQIFGIFRRLHQADEFEGTGAGLAICKKIVEGHGGRIWVESKLGQGATFFFTLPRAPVELAAAPRNGKPEKPEEAPSSAVRRRSAVHMETPAHIVVVDDQSDVGLIIKKLGQRDGLSITWFPTAEDAWEHLRHRSADLLLLDVNLPGMNGIELCRRIRTLDHLAETPVAMFTPDQEAEKLDELRAAGADFFLSKDLLCQPAAWQQRIQELLEHEPATR